MDTPKNKLLVPYDFTHIAEYALEHALGIAQTIDYDVYIFHVINKDTRARIRRENLPDDYVEKELQKIVDKASEESKVFVKYIAREGSIFTDIASVAKEIGARFVIMGTHGKKGMQHVTGSWALKVISASEVPFIVVQEKHFKHGYKNIIFPVDDSAESKQKVKWAIHIAKIFNSIVHVITSNESDSEMAARVYRNTQQIKKFFDENNIEYILKVNEEKGGNFAKAVIKYAEYVDADLIMIMTEPDAVLPVFNWGKWDEQILFNTAKTPVMCVNPRDFSIMVVGL